MSYMDVKERERNVQRQTPTELMKVMDGGVCSLDFDASSTMEAVPRSNSLKSESCEANSDFQARDMILN